MVQISEINGTVESGVSTCGVLICWDVRMWSVCISKVAGPRMGGDLRDPDPNLL